MASLPHPYITAEEYLRIERAAETRSEWFDGQMFAMAGATEAHVLIAANVAGELRNHFRGSDCRAYPLDMRVRIPATGLYTYPDVAVVCGERLFEDGRRDTLINPGVIFEVLSTSTEAYDRGKKFTHYGTVATLSDYVLVAQDEMRVHHFARAGGQWILTEVAGPDGTLRIASIDWEVKLADLYADVELEGVEGEEPI
jgi:Uma2 family endonuclease